MEDLSKSVERANKNLDITIQYLKTLSGISPRHGETRIERNLEEELKRIRLMTNEPD